MNPKTNRRAVAHLQQRGLSLRYGRTRTSHGGQLAERRRRNHLRSTASGMPTGIRAKIRRGEPAREPTTTPTRGAEFHSYGPWDA
mmetsp:Transcript_32122/g.58077  ORF Transcript_32122/g.58077 Transcript_32122/m.58077 type:complete len:85 (-) Transcript_32122:253-507(-)